MSTTVAEQAPIWLRGNSTPGARTPRSGSALWHPEPRQASELFTSSTRRALQALSLRGQNWDGADSLPPSPQAIGNASARVIELFEVATAAKWKAPFVSADEHGEVSFEWWEGPRKITLYFGDQTMEMLQVWGADVETEMLHSELHDVSDFAPAWAWLHRV